MSKQLKSLIGRQVEKRFKGLESYVVVDFRGLNSEQTSDLRKSLHAQGAQMAVVANRHAVRVLDRWEGKDAAFKALFRGPTALVFGTDGALTASKVVVQWRKKNKDILGVKGGVLGGAVMRPDGVEGLAKIPGRQQLLAQVAGTFQAPVARLARGLHNILAKVAYALDARRRKLEEEGGAAPVAIVEAPAPVA